MLTLAIVDNQHWRPGIGDPTVMGWVTVVCYFLAAGCCWLARRAVGNVAPRTAAASSRRLWTILTALFVLLGINKQLDLQSWFTQMGRDIAQSEGWYNDRRFVQAVFITIVALGGAYAIGYVIWLTRGSWRRHGPALVGVAFLMTFIVIRAASFHHVEEMLKFRLGGAKMNWVLELGGIACVGISAAMNARRPRIEPRTIREVPAAASPESARPQRDPSVKPGLESLAALLRGGDAAETRKSTRGTDHD